MPGLTASSALLLLDYQVGLCEPGPHNRAPALAAQVEQRQVLTRATMVLGAARNAGIFVGRVRLAFDPTYRLRTNRLARFDVYFTNYTGSTSVLKGAGFGRLAGETAVKQ